MKLYWKIPTIDTALRVDEVVEYRGSIAVVRFAGMRPDVSDRVELAELVVVEDHAMHVLR